LVFYRYDPYQTEDWENTPIQGIVYDAIPCDPPTIHNWHIPSPDNDYLGEGSTIEATMEDWLASTDPREIEGELVVLSKGAATTLSIYRFHDYLDNPCKPVDDTLQGFTLLGFFRANGRIVWNEESKTVTTYERTVYERSQMAIRSVYAPRDTPAGQTFIGETGTTIQAQEQTVDFMFGQPASPLDSPYPEKAVAAFFLALGSQGDNERARTYLADELKAAFYERPWGLDLTPDQLNRVLIYSISYSPDPQAEKAREDRQVTALVVPVDQNNQRLEPRRLTWRLVGIPIREKPEDCEWRLAELLGIEPGVTPGLGNLLPADRLSEGLALVP
ncbi:MAG: hypothetical protein ACRDIB_15590, partial [Ardenticatenaceae bacterium]